MNVNTLRDAIAKELRDNNANALIIDAINWARSYIYDKANWSWAGSSVGSIRTRAPASYTAVTVTDGSASVTVASNDAAQQQLTTDLANGISQYIVFGSNDRFYRIIGRSYAAPTTTLTITPAFIGTNATDDTATVYFREYALPTDLTRLGRVMDEDGSELNTFGVDELWYVTANPASATGTPSKYAWKNGVVSRVALDPVPDAVYGLHFEYVPALADVVADGSEASMVVPVQWHKLVWEIALMRLRRELLDDSRWKENADTAEVMLGDMVAQEWTGGGLTNPVRHSSRDRQALDMSRRSRRY